MTSEESMEKPENQEGPPSERPSDPIAQMLRGALEKAPEPERSFLPKIQQRIRITTKGRYYRDRWSTTRDPVSLLLMIALLILILAAALFLVMQPLVDPPEKTQLPSPADDLFSPGREEEPSSAAARDTNKIETPRPPAPKNQAPENQAPEDQGSKGNPEK